MMVRPALPTPETLTKAADLLKAGGLVAIPTETVYGLAGLAGDPAAVAKIYQTKGRPSFNPLIAHVSGIEMARQFARFTAEAEALAEAFWPGPLTLVMDVADPAPVCELARAGLQTVAVRAPDHSVARGLIDAVGTPLVAPSANPSGRISPTQASHVAGDFGDRVGLILDGGTCRAGLESTIIDARGLCPLMLRAGSLDAAAIEAVWPGLTRPQQDPKAPSAPGALSRHYAPANPVRLNVTAPAANESYLGFGANLAAAPTLNLSPTSDLIEAAANLFTMLRQLDAHQRPIAVAPIPRHGLGEAINDRLSRATTPP